MFGDRMRRTLIARRMDPLGASPQSFSCLKADSNIPLRSVGLYRWRVVLHLDDKAVFVTFVLGD